jgi:hypothetical protein
MSKPPDSIPDTLLPYATTLLVRDSCLCMQLQRAARSLARRFDQAFRPLGLTNGQFSLLMSLNRPHPPQIGDVADLLGMDRTSITAMLKPLARRGLELHAQAAVAHQKRSRVWQQRVRDGIRWL